MNQTHKISGIFLYKETLTRKVKSLREDEELVSAGFEYVTEHDGVKISRKRK